MRAFLSSIATVLVGWVFTTNALAQETPPAPAAEAPPAPAAEAPPAPAPKTKREKKKKKQQHKDAASQQDAPRADDDAPKDSFAGDPFGDDAGGVSAGALSLRVLLQTRYGQTFAKPSQNARPGYALREDVLVHDGDGFDLQRFFLRLGADPMPVYAADTPKWSGVLPCDRVESLERSRSVPPIRYVNPKTA